MNLESKLLNFALARALDTIDANMITFAELYPDDATMGNVYLPRKPLNTSMADGANWGWTTGFLPGMIWLAYELTGAAKYRKAGEQQIVNFSERIAHRVWVDHHDLGFLYTPSCVAPARILGHEVALRTAIEAADLLMMRFWDKPGIFQAWGAMDDPNERGRTIVDSLMNMPLLYWASEMTGDARYATAAHRHACQLAAHALRPDGTTFHTYYFDTETGAPRFGNTSQGFADNSCWSRGQAWTMYGFALNYAYTRDAKLLEAARRVTEYYLAHLPTDRVAYWDLVFGDGSAEERDSSAAAIAVCGLLELANCMPSGEHRQRYQSEASAMLASLITAYTPEAGDRSNALLLHGVYSKPHGGGVNEGNLWGDYFYLEAIMRMLKPDWVRYW